MSYQDRWVAGRTAKIGQRECVSRYQAIRDILDLYTRPFTVLDLGASEGYFSFRISEDYPATVVAIEGGSQLLPLCEENHAEIIHLPHRITVRELQLLATCEHFDVVLALNVLHHFSDSEGAAKAVMDLGDNVIIETPHLEDSAACGQAQIPKLMSLLSRSSTRIIAETPSHVSAGDRPMFHIQAKRKSISRAYIDVPKSVRLEPISIASTETSKTVTFHGKKIERDWLPGINLQTYRYFTGVWPPRECLADQIRGMALPDPVHGDIRPWNFVLSRNGLDLIDGRDGKAVYDDAHGIQMSAEAVMEGYA